MLEDWIDLLAKRMEFDGKVKSYRLFEKRDFPGVIDIFPSAITYPTSLKPEVSSGLQYLFWSGVTELHLDASVDKSKIPDLVPWIGKILAVVYGDMQLGGAVNWVAIDNDRGGIQGPTELTYGTESPHWGILLFWSVKENVTGSITVA